MSTQVLSPFAPLEVTLFGASKFISKDSGETVYIARCEIPTPGLQWSTCRVTLIDSKPLANGTAKIVLTKFEGGKGVATGKVVA